MRTVGLGGGRRGAAVTRTRLMRLALLFLALAAAPLAAAEKPGADATANSNVAAPGEYANSVTVGVGDLILNADKGAGARRLQQRDGAYGGIEELHLEQPVGKKGQVDLDGRAMFNNHDYSIKLGVKNPDIGYLRGGYSEFRTWYDGSGGYSPRSNAWVTLYDEQLHMDRRQAWIEGGLTLPDWPTMSFRYSYDTRMGMKDSTIWGDYNLTLNPANTVQRGIIPTFRDIDERRHTVDADLRHTIGNTTFGVGLRYEHDSIDNSLNIARRIGEPTRVRDVTQVDKTDADIFNVHDFVEIRLRTNLLFTVGSLYSRLDTDIGGSRIYGPSYNSPLNPLYVNRQANDEGFFDVSGGSRVDQYVANLNLMWMPWPHVTIVPSVRVEHQDQVGSALFMETRVTNSATAIVTNGLLNNRTRDFTDVSEKLELRYTGVTNWVFYTRGEWLEGQGTLRENEFDVEDEGVGPLQLQRNTDSCRFVQKYVVGVNWYPCRQANLAAQYYYRSARNDYSHNVDSTFYDPPPAPVNTNNLYPAFILRHQFDTHDVNFRFTLRPLANLTLVSRYDFTLTRYRMQGNVDSFGVSLGLIQSAESTAHIFSQSISWSPLAQLYLQGSGSYAAQRTESPAAYLTGGAAGLVQHAENDYWNASVSAGWAFSRMSDLQAVYSYYRANNYDPGNATVGLPYGAGAEQHSVTTTLVNRLRKNLLWKIQYGFFTGRDETYGFHNNYDAHLVYSSMQYSF